MPIFEYQCRSCRNQFETLVRRSSEVVCCPQCKGTDVNKLMSSCCFSSKGGDGSVKRAAGASGCSGCSSSSCSSCH